MEGCNMLAGRVYMGYHNQVASIVCRNICAKAGLEVTRSKWDAVRKVVENDQVKILWVFQIQKNKW